MSTPLLLHIGFVLFVLLTALFAHVFSRQLDLSMKYLLGIGGGYLLALIFLHLIPEIYINEHFSIGLVVLIGFVFQMALDFFSKGIEHGHLHQIDKHAFPWSVFLALALHSFFEGMPVIEHNHGAGDTEVLHIASTSFLFGLVVHKIPITFVLVILLKRAAVKPLAYWSALVVFALSMPLGSFAAYMLAHTSLSELIDVHAYTTAIAIGILIHISTTILFESNESHKFDLVKFTTIIGGMLLYLFTI